MPGRYGVLRLLRNYEHIVEMSSGCESCNKILFIDAVSIDIPSLIADNLFNCSEIQYVPLFFCSSITV
jgi:hypothetical protein